MCLVFNSTWCSSVITRVLHIYMSIASPIWIFLMATLSLDPFLSLSPHQTRSRSIVLHSLILSSLSSIPCLILQSSQAASNFSVGSMDRHLGLSVNLKLVWQYLTVHNISGVMCIATFPVVLNGPDVNLVPLRCRLQSNIHFEIFVSPSLRKMCIDSKKWSVLFRHCSKRSYCSVSRDLPHLYGPRLWTF